MKTIESLVPGSSAWLKSRSASKAPAIMGDSKHQKYTELLKQMATGLKEEVDKHTQERFDAGNASEAAARTIAEEDMMGKFPAKCGSTDDGYLTANFDGLLADTFDGEFDGRVAWEHKVWNEELAAAVRAGTVPDSHAWQLDQQIFVGGLEYVLFMVSDGTRDKCVSMEYRSTPERAKKLLAGWRQFDEDLAAYRHTDAATVAIAAPVADLPVLFVQARGEVTSTNMPSFKVAVAEFLGGLNMKPSNDQEFADSKAIASKLRDGAKALLAKKAEMLAQTASIGEVAAECDAISKKMNAAALELEKKVEIEESNRKGRLIQSGQDQFSAHIASLEKRIGMRMPAVPADFAKSIKGKSKLESMENGIAIELARAKIVSNEVADKIDANMKRYTEIAAGYEFLFRDIETLAVKDADGFEAIVTQRINNHAKEEAERLEAERQKIRAEEEARATAKAKAEQEEAERQRKAAEAAAAKIMSDRATEAAMEEHRMLEQGRAAQNNPQQASQTIGEAGMRATPVGGATKPATEPATRPAPASSSGRLDETAVVAASTVGDRTGNLRAEIDALLIDFDAVELIAAIQSLRSIKARRETRAAA